MGKYIGKNISKNLSGKYSQDKYNSINNGTLKNDKFVR